MKVKALKYSIAISIMPFASFTSPLLAMELDVLNIDGTIKSQNFRQRGDKKPQVLVLHCIGFSDEWVFKNYIFPVNENFPEEKRGLSVSAHYYISQSGKLYQLVSEENSALHAGVSEWRSLAQKNRLQGLNDLSIGIEFQSLGYGQIEGKGCYPYSFAPFSEEEMKFGILLAKQTMKKNNISPENVVWHSDVSLSRTTDPGSLFDGKRLARNGIGVWPSADRLEDSQLNVSLNTIQRRLKNWGYPIEETGLFDDATRYGLTAHYMHYLPKEVNWETYRTQKVGSIFGNVKKWEEFPYDKEILAISLDNLNKRNFEF